MRAIEWKDGDIVVIDQTLLPQRVEHRALATTDDVAEAIVSLRVRGAPALGIVGAMGVAQAALRAHSSSPQTVIARAEDAGRVLAATRPTAVNLSWGIDRVLSCARSVGLTAGPQRLASVMVDEALRIQREDRDACDKMARNALEFFRPQGVVLTHCNTGMLCTGGNGTALGAIRHAHDAGLGVAVIVSETRPLLQGARLTAWELASLEIPHALIVDSAAAGLMARGELSLVVVGADRIAANGDVANKVGTYGHALAAAANHVPFIVVAPTSTIDLSIAAGEKIEVEERRADEVTSVLGMSIAPAGTNAINPAFDVTPAHLITAIVTERGVARPPFEDSLAELFGASSKKRAPKKPAAKKPAPKRAAAKKPAAKKAAPKKPAAKKPAARKPVKPAARRAPKRGR